MEPQHGVILDKWLTHVVDLVDLHMEHKPLVFTVAVDSNEKMLELHAWRMPVQNVLWVT